MMIFLMCVRGVRDERDERGRTYSYIIVISNIGMTPSIAQR